MEWRGRWRGGVGGVAGQVERWGRWRGGVVGVVGWVEWVKFGWGAWSRVGVVG